MSRNLTIRELGFSTILKEKMYYYFWKRYTMTMESYSGSEIANLWRFNPLSRKKQWQFSENYDHILKSLWYNFKPVPVFLLFSNDSTVDTFCLLQSFVCLCVWIWNIEKHSASYNSFSATSNLGYVTLTCIVIQVRCKSVVVVKCAILTGVLIKTYRQGHGCSKARLVW